MPSLAFYCASSSRLPLPSYAFSHPRHVKPLSPILDLLIRMSLCLSTTLRWKRKQPTTIQFPFTVSTYPQFFLMRSHKWESPHMVSWFSSFLAFQRVSQFLILHGRPLQPPNCTYPIVHILIPMYIPVTKTNVPLPPEQKPYFSISDPNFSLGSVGL